MRSGPADIQRGIAVEESFQSLYALYYSRVIGLFQRRGLPLEESRDLAQDTFVRLFRSIATFRRGESFAPWLFGIANNVYLNEARQRRLARRVAAEIHLEEAIDASPEPTAPGGPLDDLLDTERSDSLHKVLAELPPQMRKCVQLRIKGYKYQEIATIMRVSIQTVKAHLFQARSRLAQQLTDHDPLADLDS